MTEAGHLSTRLERSRDQRKPICGYKQLRVNELRFISLKSVGVTEMLKKLFHRKLDAEEKKLGASMDYLRHILNTSPGAFFRFASIMPFANSRKTLPPSAWFVAQIVALGKEDCGPCLQIAVNLASTEKVPAKVIQAAIDGRPEDLEDTLANVFRFAQSVVDGNDDDALREIVRKEYGDCGLIEIAYSIASSRIPPTVKRALGYAKSCRAVKIEV